MLCWIELGRKADFVERQTNSENVNEVDVRT